MPDTEASGSRSPSQIGAAALEERPIELIMPMQQRNIPNTWGKFDGDQRNWIRFRDRFKAAIHDNKGILDVYKQSYLLQSLTGSALETLRKGRLANEIYLRAWERLLEVYDDPYAIAREHMQNFYSLPVLQGPATSLQLERMTNVTHEVIRQLRALEYPTEHWDFIFVQGLHDRLDDKTSRDWELTRQVNNPSVLHMLEFLDEKAAALKYKTYN